MSGLTFWGGLGQLKMDIVQCIVFSFPRQLYMLSGFVCVHIRQYNLCLSHVYIDLCCGDGFYSCL